MTEQEYFNNMVRLLTDAENTRLSVKALQDGRHGIKSEDHQTQPSRCC